MNSWLILTLLGNVGLLAFLNVRWFLKLAHQVLHGIAELRCASQVSLSMLPRHTLFLSFFTCVCLALATSVVWTR